MLYSILILLHWQMKLLRWEKLLINSFPIIGWVQVQINAICKSWVKFKLNRIRQPYLSVQTIDINIFFRWYQFTCVLRLIWLRHGNPTRLLNQLYQTSFKTKTSSKLPKSTLTPWRYSLMLFSFTQNSNFIISEAIETWKYIQNLYFLGFISICFKITKRRCTYRREGSWSRCKNDELGPRMQCNIEMDDASYSSIITK